MIVHFDPKLGKFNRFTTILGIECFIDKNQDGRVFFVVFEGLLIITNVSTFGTKIY